MSLENSAEVNLILVVSQPMFEDVIRLLFVAAVTYEKVSDLNSSVDSIIQALPSMTSQKSNPILVHQRSVDLLAYADSCEETEAPL